jgi:sulfide:quinone oxidoreductase
MKINKLTESLSVRLQITVPDMQTIKEQGFRSIICNRPDGEGSDQPTFEEIAKAAKELDIEAVYLPIVSGRVGDDDAVEFGNCV